MIQRQLAQIIVLYSLWVQKTFTTVFEWRLSKDAFETAPCLIDSWSADLRVAVLQDPIPNRLFIPSQHHGGTFHDIQVLGGILARAVFSELILYLQTSMSG